MENDEAQAVLVTRLVDPQPPQVQLDLRAHRLVFDQQGPASPEPAPGPTTVPPSKESSGKVAVPPVALNGKISIAEARLEHVTVQQLAVDISLMQGLLKSQQQFQLYGGSYQGQSQVNLARPEADVTLEAKLAGVQIGPMLHEVASLSPGMSGALDTQLTLAGRGLTWQTLSHTLTGGGQVRVGGIQWRASDLLGAFIPVLQSVGNVAGFAVPADLAHRSFDTLQAPFRIAQGKVVSDHVQLLAKDIEVLAEAALGSIARSWPTEHCFSLVRSPTPSAGVRHFCRTRQGASASPSLSRVPSAAHRSLSTSDNFWIWPNSRWVVPWNSVLVKS